MSPDAPVYYAHKRIYGERTIYDHASPDRGWLDLFGIDDPVVALRVRERHDGDPVSDYWGWLDAEKPHRYILVWPSRIQFNCCFTYGPAVEEQRGRGRSVNLIVEEIGA